MKKTLIKLITIPFFILGLAGCSMIDEINEKHRIEKLATKTNIDIHVKGTNKEYKENTEKLHIFFTSTVIITKILSVALPILRYFLTIFSSIFIQE